MVTRSDAYGAKKAVVDAMGVQRPCDYTKQIIMTLNLCNFFVFTRDKELCDRLGIAARSEQIVRMISSISPDIVVLQEGGDRHVSVESFMMTATKIASRLKMELILQRNNADPACFFHVVLYKPDKYFHQASSRFYPRERKEDRLFWGDEAGDGFGRQTTVNVFYPKRTKEIKPGVWGEIPDYQQRPLKILNQHFGLGKRERDLHIRVTQEEMSEDKKSHIFSLGDYNPLPHPGDPSVEEQMMPWSTNGWARLTKPPYLSQHGIEAGSFIGFPTVDAWARRELSKPDGLLKKGHFNEQLDHIVYKSPSDGLPDYVAPDGKHWKQSFAFKTYNVIGRFDGTDLPAPQKETDYLLDPQTGEDLRERSYSDHNAVVAEITQHWVIDPSSVK